VDRLLCLWRESLSGKSAVVQDELQRLENCSSPSFSDMDDRDSEVAAHQFGTIVTYLAIEIAIAGFSARWE
jgi:hypothetical protein